jgi:hypothetical protein
MPRLPRTVFRWSMWFIQNWWKSRVPNHILALSWLTVFILDRSSRRWRYASVYVANHTSTNGIKGERFQVLVTDKLVDESMNTSTSIVRFFFIPRCRWPRSSIGMVSSSIGRTRWTERLWWHNVPLLQGILSCMTSRRRTRAEHFGTKHFLLRKLSLTSASGIIHISSSSTVGDSFFIGVNAIYFWSRRRSQRIPDHLWPARSLPGDVWCRWRSVSSTCVVQHVLTTK